MDSDHCNRDSLGGVRHRGIQLETAKVATLVNGRWRRQSLGGARSDCRLACVPSAYLRSDPAGDGCVGVFSTFSVSCIEFSISFGICLTTIVVYESDYLGVDKSTEERIKALLLDGYISDTCVRRKWKNTEFEITQFQGEHRDEYMVKDVISGECRLFRKGMLELSWREKSGKRVGGFTVFEKGKVIRKESWRGLLHQEEFRYIENSRGNRKMIIRRGKKNHVVYQGGCEPNSLNREGEGYEYDEESGRVLLHGVWKNDELFQIYQEFESESVMIEYDVNKVEENVSVQNRRPTYIGSYAFSELEGKYVRHGVGNEIDVNNGIAKSECEWVNGAMKSSVELFGGWYVEGREEDSLRDIVLEEYLEAVEISNELEWYSIYKNVMDIIVSSNACNEESMTQLSFSHFKCLKRIVVGNDCFLNVNEVRLTGVGELESVVIGMKCFTRKKEGFGNDPNRHFYLKNCPKLKALIIGRYSFSDYSVCKIENVRALEVIEMGDLKEWSGSFHSSSLELKSRVVNGK